MMNIGVFDSGLGGLSIFREILTQLPEYDYIYFGDNARLPYGGRSNELIYSFAKNAVAYLFQQDCQLIIIACNTVSASALRRLQQEYLPKHFPNRRILGVILPVVEAAVSKNVRRVGVVGTRATISSNSYPEEIKKLAPYVQVYQKACPLLVPIIEEDEMSWEGLDLIIEKYLQPLLVSNIDSLILGCTHYGLIADKIKKHLPEPIQVISQAIATTEKLGMYLQRHPEIEATLSQNANRVYFATDVSQRYEKLTKLFLGEHFSDEAHVQLVQI